MGQNDFDKILMDALTGPIYYGRTDLMYRKEYGFGFTSFEYGLYNNFKVEEHLYDEKYKVVLPLYSFNSKSLFFYIPQEFSDLVGEFTSKIDVRNNLSSDIISLICSELDGTLRIEGVNSTRRQIMNAIQNKESENKNDQIIRNMYDGLRYVLSKPAFNKDNLKKLYDILAEDCLDKENDIGDQYYRFDSVEIDKYQGCPSEKIDIAMDSLFSFVNQNIAKKSPAINKALMPHICHYYVLYIHPYFDYNGRTARMVYLWVASLLGYEKLDPLFLSEAINDKKGSYYNALRETRESQNDLTYFLIFCLSLSNSYQIIYNNCKYMKDKIESEYGEELLNNDIYNVRRILINQQNNYFFSKTYETWTKREVSRQSTHKELTKLEKFGILLSKSDGKKKIYKINEAFIPFIVPKVKEY